MWLNSCSKNYYSPLVQNSSQFVSSLAGRGLKLRRRSRKLVAVCAFLGIFLLFVSQHYAQAERQRATDGASGDDSSDRSQSREIELRQTPKKPPAESTSGFSRYLSSARNFLSAASEAHKNAKTYSSFLSNESPKAQQMLSDSIAQTTNLIESYRQEGLANMPPLPNLPGIGNVARLPDKLLRAELSMLQDLIRMAQETRERPITATVNAPRGK